MERKTSKLEQHQQPELEAQQQTQSAPPGKAFENVDELLRYDAAQTEPPVELKDRLARSVESTPPAALPWWRRWLGTKES
jgi:hypothetical protein